MSWNVIINEKQKKAQLEGANIKELVSFDPPITNPPPSGIGNGSEGIVPGVLVTYTPGRKWWAGRGQQKYYPAHYTVHVVTHATHNGEGRWDGTCSRHVDIPCQPSKART